MYKNDIIGWLSIWDSDAISKIAGRVPAGGNVVEVGSLMGKSSITIADSVPNTVNIYCIDWFDEKQVVNSFKEFPSPLPQYCKVYNCREEFIKNTANYKNIHMIIGHSPGCFTETHIIHTLQIDMFFLDASHSNPNDWDNIEYFLPRMKSGSIICGHDYSPQFPDVQTNVTRLESLLNQSVTRYTNSSVWSFTLQ